MAKLAKGAGTVAPQIDKLESGERRMTFEWANRLAPPLNVQPEELMAPLSLVPIVGYVGAGQFIAFDDHAKGQGLDEIECPRGLDPRRTVAVRVRGDSMAPLIQDGWLLFYSRDPEPDAAAVLGRTCVVKLAGDHGQDGDTMVRQVRRGPTAGRFNLVSNSGIVEDVELEWAAPVLELKAPI